MGATVGPVGLVNLATVKLCVCGGEEEGKTRVNCQLTLPCLPLDFPLIRFGCGKLLSSCPVSLDGGTLDGRGGGGGPGIDDAIYGTVHLVFAVYGKGKKRTIG